MRHIARLAITNKQTSLARALSLQVALRLQDELQSEADKTSVASASALDAKVALELAHRLEAEAEEKARAERAEDRQTAELIAAEQVWEEDAGTDHAMRARQHELDEQTARDLAAKLQECDRGLSMPALRGGSVESYSDPSLRLPSALLTHLPTARGPVATVVRGSGAVSTNSMTDHSGPDESSLSTDVSLARMHELAAYASSDPVPNHGVDSEQWRTEAMQAQRQMMECYRQAAEAQQKRDGGAALSSILTQRGNQHKVRMKAYHRQASAACFRSANPLLKWEEWAPDGPTSAMPLAADACGATANNTNVGADALDVIKLQAAEAARDGGQVEIDLHGLRCAEAVEIVRVTLSAAQEERLLRSTTSRGSTFTFISGVGRHSRDGQAKIQPALQKLLEEWPVAGAAVDSWEYKFGRFTVWLR